MPGIQHFISLLEQGGLDARLAEMYGSQLVLSQKKRYQNLLDSAKEPFKGNDVILVSASGRSELGGNHTDHNHGNVLAAGVHLDHLAVARKNQQLQAKVISRGFPEILVNLADLDPNPQEHGTPEAIIRGVAAGLVKQDNPICGFTAHVDSIVPVGSGLSSSAAFEVLICLILKKLTGNTTLTTFDIAKIAKDAENVHFGKPCGFMDQIACAYNGILHIDFDDPMKPDIHPIDFNFEQHGYQLVIVQTGGDHVNLTEEYAAIPRDMKAAAKCVGKEVAREVSIDQLWNNATRIREEAGDRAFLRLYHFITENERAMLQAEALRQNNIVQFLQYVKTSGDSSFKYLQNCVDLQNQKHQPIPAALAMSDYFLRDQGACRVHGGGFGGTIQCLVPMTMFAEYKDFIENCFGKGSVIPLHVRQSGFEYIESNPA